MDIKAILTWYRIIQYNLKFLLNNKLARTRSGLSGDWYFQYSSSKLVHFERSRWSRFQPKTVQSPVYMFLHLPALRYAQLNGTFWRKLWTLALCTLTYAAAGAATLENKFAQQALLCVAVTHCWATAEKVLLCHESWYAQLGFRKLWNEKDKIATDDLFCSPIHLVKSMGS